MMPPFGSDIATPLKSSTRDLLRDGRLWEIIGLLRWSMRKPV
jgi:hypothetical protein